MKNRSKCLKIKNKQQRRRNKKRMKRLCTKQEREVLYKNRKQMIKGKFGTASNMRWGDVFVSLGLAIIIWFGIMFYIMFTDVVKVDFTRGGMKCLLTLCLLVVYSIVGKVMSRIRRKREEKRFQKKDNIMVNGATIVEVDLSGNFAYIEDDVCDENGRPIIMDYAFSSGEVKPRDVGKRMLVLYDGELGFRLVMLNEELSGFIPNTTYDYPLKENIRSYTRVPHPNLVNLEKEEHQLSEHEKEFFADLYLKAEHKVYAKIQKVCAVIFTVCIILFTVLFCNIDEGYAFSTCIMYGAVGFCCMIVFLGGLGLLRKKISKGRSKFVAVKQVVFVSQGLRDRLSVVKVLEWNRDQVQLFEYQNELPAKTPYGSVLYKLVNPKGKIFLVNANPVK